MTIVFFIILVPVKLTTLAITGRKYIDWKAVWSIKAMEKLDDHIQKNGIRILCQKLFKKQSKWIKNFSIINNFTLKKQITRI